MDEIMALADEYNLMVVEDCCQAHLARWKDKSIGSFGAFGAFSFYPGKNLGAFGEAGALITHEEDLFLKAKMIRQHGEIERYNHRVIGHNYRMEAIQGAVLATKLKYLKEWTQKRKKKAQLYTKLLKDVDGIQTPMEFDGTECVYHLYVVQTDDRDGLQQYLQQNGIATGLHYPIPLHLQEAYKHLGYKEGDFPVAEKAAKRILSLPMYPELTEKQIRYVCDKIQEFNN
jgi:dTDP-4-amino-4,6-dideoxygalactose transaminase